MGNKRRADGVRGWRCAVAEAVACAVLLAAVGPVTAAEDSFRLEELDGRRLKVWAGEQPVLVYNFGEQLAQGAPANMRRSSYVHPIHGLDDQVLTDDFPKDHYHHRGLFWAWSQVTVDGKTHDPWGVVGMHTRFEKWLERQTSPHWARLGVQNGWYVEGRKVVDEKMRLQAWRAEPGGRPIDVDLTFTAMDRAVQISGRPPVKGYGGFGLRFAPHGPPAIHTVAGRATTDVVQGKSPWADYSARFGDAKTTAGIAIFDAKSNPGFPNGWLLRHYGYIGLTWPGLESYTLEPGRPLNLKYRVWVHKGGFEDGRVKQAYEAYIAPPEE